MQRSARVDAKEHVVSAGVVLRQVMGVASGHQRQAEAAGDVDRPVGAELLNLEAVVLDFDVEVVAENGVEPAGKVGGFVDPVLQNQFAELAGSAAAEADQAVGMG